MNANVSCPYCGEDNTISVDPAGGRRQDYVEDCHVCCQPWQLTVTFDADGDPEIAIRTGEE